MKNIIQINRSIKTIVTIVVCLLMASACDDIDETNRVTIGNMEEYKIEGNEVTVEVDGQSFTYTDLHRILIEDFTGWRCVNCPNMAAFLINNIENIFPSVVVSLHPASNSLSNTDQVASRFSLSCTLADEIANTSEQSKSLTQRNDTLFRSGIFGRRIRRLIRSIIQEDVKDSGKQSASDSDPGLLGAAPLFEDLVLGEDFRIQLRARIAGSDSALNKQGFEVLPCFADASCLLLVGAFVVLRGKTSPGTKVFGRLELAHISPDFCNHTNGSHGIGDTGDGKQQFDLAGIRFSKLKDELLQRIPKVIKIGDMFADDLVLFRLPGREGAIYGLLDFLWGSLAAPVKKRCDIKGFTRMLQQLTDNGGRALAEHVTEHVIQFEVGDRETVLGTVLLSRGIPDELLIVAAQVTQLTNILRRDKAAANQIVLEKVGDPHGIFLIRLLAFDGFDELGMRNDDMEVLFKDVVNGEPILAGGLHADIRAMVLLEPGCEFAQITRIG